MKEAIDLSAQPFAPDAPLLLLQHELTRALTRVDSLLRSGRMPEHQPGPFEAPDSARREALRELVPRWHFAMLNDLARNSLFQEAIEHAVRAGDHVLDIGSGSGLLAMLAARAGASHVTSCETVRTIATAASRVVADNGLTDMVTIVNQPSQDLIVGIDLPRRADVIMTEIVDCGLVGEGLIPTMRHAREHLLRPGGTLIPHTARLMAAPVNSMSIAQLNQVDYACGFDVSYFNEFASCRYFPVRLRTWPHQFLAQPSAVISFDFVRDRLDPGERVVDFSIRHDGLAHGMAFWFELALDGKRVISNEPGNRDCHWHQAFQIFPEPVELRAGDRMRLLLTHTDSLVHFTPIGGT